MTNKTSQKTWDGWNWFGLIVVSVIVFAIAVPNVNRAPYGKVKEAEVKQNLHAIQLSVERFAVDTEGVYPKYLIGGAPADPNGTPGTIAFTSDVLLREGYLDNYPRNPFMRREKPRSLSMQDDLPSSITGNDPLRPGDPEGDLLGYRFGADGNLMGQVLCDPRHEKWFVNDQFSGELVERNTWAIIEYPFWDTWNGKKHEPEILPGMFFYKGIGPVIANGDTDSVGEAEEPQGANNKHLSIDGDRIGPRLPYPVEVDHYIMGAYGSLRTGGMDMMGDETNAEMNILPMWTRSAYSTTNFGGSPYFFSADGKEGKRGVNYDANGIGDGIIIVLTAGEDWIGDS